MVNTVLLSANQIADIFCVSDKFKKYLSSRHPNINLSIEKEKDGCLPFVDVNLFRENEKFVTNVYRKIPSVGLIPTSKVFYLKHIKLV